MFYAHEFFININMAFSFFAAMLVMFALMWDGQSLVRRLSLGLAGSLLMVVNFFHMLILLSIRDRLVTAYASDVPLEQMTKLFLSFMVLALALIIGFGLFLRSVAKRTA